MTLVGKTSEVVIKNNNDDDDDVDNNTHQRYLCFSPFPHQAKVYNAWFESRVYEVGRERSLHIEATLVPFLNGSSLSHQPMVLPHNSQYFLPGLSAAKKPLKKGLFWLVV